MSAEDSSQQKALQRTTQQLSTPGQLSPAAARAIYLGTFLIAFTTLALEITLTRILSVTTWYHLAFFAIGVAMLGMTAGATTVYLRSAWFTEAKLAGALAKASLGYALITPPALILILMIPAGFHQSIMGLMSIIAIAVICGLPFYCSGVAISAVLTKSQLPMGKLYASDLIGASLGCLFVLGGLELLDGPSLVLLSSAIGALAAYAFASAEINKAFRRLSLTVAALLAVAVGLNASTMVGIQPLVVKGQLDGVEWHLLDRWNSFSRIVVYKGEEAPPQYWGASPKAPQEPVYQYGMVIDGLAGTTMRKFATNADIDHLRYDVTNAVYHLRPRGGAAVIGVGGARDIQSALLFGHERVYGIDVNPIFIDLLQNEFRDFAGVANREEVTLVVDEARSFLSHTDQQFAVIQMTVIDTFAATGAGAFSLSENALYTIEAWEVFLDRLTDDGIFTVSRWYSPTNIGETGRSASLAVAALLQMGVKDPSQHIAMLGTDMLSTLLVSKQPFTAAEIAALQTLSSDLQFTPIIMPGVTADHAILAKIVAAASPEALTQAVVDEPLNYAPPTDEQPYFFNMLRLDRIAWDKVFGASDAELGTGGGNLKATLTLVAMILTLFVLALATIVFPLLFWRQRDDAQRAAGMSPGFVYGAVYFSLIGAGFMLVEIALMQRLSVFLSHPVYALGIVLFSIIASTGIGSYLSDSLPLTRTPWVFLYPLIMVAVILIVQSALSTLLVTMITASMLVKTLSAILVILPMGLVMGLFFPTGMKLVKQTNAAEAPWYWALNGIWGVLSSAIAIFISIYVSVSLNFVIGAVCYGLLPLCIIGMMRAQRAFTARRPALGAVQEQPAVAS